MTNQIADLSWDSVYTNSVKGISDDLLVDKHVK